MTDTKRIPLTGTNPKPPSLKPNPLVTAEHTSNATDTHTSQAKDASDTRVEAAIALGFKEALDENVPKTQTEYLVRELRKILTEIQTSASRVSALETRVRKIRDRQRPVKKQAATNVKEPLTNESSKENKTYEKGEPQ